MKLLRRTVHGWWRPWVATAFFCASCTAPDQGSLRVAALVEGSYEIYRIEQESPFQFVSEQVGKFNRDVALDVGHYVIMADCSSVSVTITPGTRKELTAHLIRFSPPVKPKPNDSFVIQCTREDRVSVRQTITNRFSLNVLESDRAMLVGMRPLIAKIAASSKNKPQSMEYSLGAIHVESSTKSRSENHFSVSPLGGTAAVTVAQLLGSRVFLLPGAYALELNGSREDVTLAEGQDLIVQSASLRVQSPDGIDLAQSARITGSPAYVEINDDHWLNVDETYEVLPGTISLAVSGSRELLPVVAKEGEAIILSSRAARVDLACPVEDVRCVGSRKVHLFRGSQPESFVVGVTDASILFLGEDVSIGLEGSKKMRWRVPDSAKVTEIKTGKVVFKPNAIYRPGLITEFARLESLKGALSGQSMDYSLERPTTLSMFAGNYDLVHLTNAAAGEGLRSRYARPFTLLPGQTVELELDVYVSEKIFRAIQEQRAKMEKLSPPPLPKKSPQK